MTFRRSTIAVMLLAAIIMTLLVSDFMLGSSFGGRTRGLLFRWDGSEPCVPRSPHQSTRVTFLGDDWGKVLSKEVCVGNDKADGEVNGAIRHNCAVSVAGEGVKGPQLQLDVEFRADAFLETAAPGFTSSASDVIVLTRGLADMEHNNTWPSAFYTSLRTQLLQVRKAAAAHQSVAFALMPTAQVAGAAPPLDTHESCHSNERIDTYRLLAVCAAKWATEQSCGGGAAQKSACRVSLIRLEETVAPLLEAINCQSGGSSFPASITRDELGECEQIETLAATKAKSGAAKGGSATGSNVRTKLIGRRKSTPHDPRTVVARVTGRTQGIRSNGFMVEPPRSTPIDTFFPSFDRHAPACSCIRYPLYDECLSSRFQPRFAVRGANEDPGHPDGSLPMNRRLVRHLCAASTQLRAGKVVRSLPTQTSLKKLTPAQMSEVAFELCAASASAASSSQLKNGLSVESMVCLSNLGAAVNVTSSSDNRDICTCRSPDSTESSWCSGIEARRLALSKNVDVQECMGEAAPCTTDSLQ